MFIGEFWWRIDDVTSFFDDIFDQHFTKIVKSIQEELDAEKKKNKDKKVTRSRNKELHEVF